jgi:hypothetical protein
MIPARDNPFASHRVESLKYRYPGFNFDEAVAQLEQMQWRAAILGPHGTGKTTLLLELHRHLQSTTNDRSESTRVWFVPLDRSSRNQQWLELLEECSPQTILLVDGIERLRWSRRIRLLGLGPSWIRQSSLPRSIIVTTHRSIGLPVWLRTTSNSATMEELLLELHPAASPETIDQARKLFTTRRGNIRDVFWKLYDCC